MGHPVDRVLPLFVLGAGGRAAQHLILALALQIWFYYG